MVSRQVNIIKGCNNPITYFVLEFDFGEERIQKIVICPMCFSNALSISQQAESSKVLSARNISCFPLECLAGMTLKGHSITCPFHENFELPLEQLIPDLLMKDIRGLFKFNENELVLGEKIATGMQQGLLTIMLLF